MKAQSSLRDSTCPSPPPHQHYVLGYDQDVPPGLPARQPRTRAVSFLPRGPSPSLERLGHPGLCIANGRFLCQPRRFSPQGSSSVPCPCALLPRCLWLRPQAAPSLSGSLAPFPFARPHALANCCAVQIRPQKCYQPPPFGANPAHSPFSLCSSATSVAPRFSSPFAIRQSSIRNRQLPRPAPSRPFPFPAPSSPLDHLPT